MSGQLFTAHHMVLAAGTKVILLFVLTPVLAGLVGAVLPATGWFPPIGGDSISLSPLRTFLLEPGLITSVSLSIFTALMATTLSYLLAIGLLAVLVGTGRWAFLTRLISPLLSVPHITIAVGFLFLLQPSGWLIRLLSPWATGWDRPPNLNLVPDEAGWMLVTGLVAKEVLGAGGVSVLGDLSPCRGPVTVASLFTWRGVCLVPLSPVCHGDRILAGSGPPASLPDDPVDRHWYGGDVRDPDC